MSGCCMGWPASYCATHECPSNPKPVAPPRDERVTESCGCVFRDLNIPCLDTDCKICIETMAPDTYTGGNFNGVLEGDKS